MAFYSDKHGIFRVNHKASDPGDGMTQFGRALDELNIEIICANSPRPRAGSSGRTKRLQDRLVKELRLRGISTMAGGNALLPAFMADYNARFAKTRGKRQGPAPCRVARRYSGGRLCLEGGAHVSRALTLQYDKVLFVLEPTEIARRPSPQAGDRARLTRWPACHPLQRHRAGLHPLRQAAAGLPGRDRREQAARRRSRLDPRAADPRWRAKAQRQGAAPARSDKPAVSGCLNPLLLGRHSKGKMPRSRQPTSGDMSNLRGW